LAFLVALVAVAVALAISVGSIITTPRFMLAEQESQAKDLLVVLEGRLVLMAAVAEAVVLVSRVQIPEYMGEQVNQIKDLMV
jgi:hypothetical protein